MRIQSLEQLTDRRDTFRLNGEASLSFSSADEHQFPNDFEASFSWVEQCIVKWKVSEEETYSIGQSANVLPIWEGRLIENIKCDEILPMSQLFPLQYHG